MSAIPNRYWVLPDAVSDMWHLIWDINWFLDNAHDYDETERQYILTQMKRILQILIRIY